MTETGNWITPSRVSILETLTKVTAQPPKLQSKSTIGWFENIFFQIRNMGTRHPWFSVVLLIGAVIALLYIVRNGNAVKQGLNSVGRRNKGSGGYFVLGDEKGTGGGLGILGGGGSNANGKAD